MDRKPVVAVLIPKTLLMEQDLVVRTLTAAIIPLHLQRGEIQIYRIV